MLRLLFGNFMQIITVCFHRESYKIIINSSSDVKKKRRKEEKKKKEKPFAISREKNSIEIK
jgi:hypothetical protein